MKRLLSVVAALVFGSMLLSSQAVATTSVTKWNPGAYNSLVLGCGRTGMANGAALLNATQAVVYANEAVADFQQVIARQSLRGKDKTNFKKLIAHLQKGNTDYSMFQSCHRSRLGGR